MKRLIISCLLGAILISKIVSAETSGEFSLKTNSGAPLPKAHSKALSETIMETESGLDYIALRSVAELVDGTINWDENNKSVEINFGDTHIPREVTESVKGKTENGINYEYIGMSDNRYYEKYSKMKIYKRGAIFPLTFDSKEMYEEWLKSNDGKYYYGLSKQKAVDSPKDAADIVEEYISLEYLNAVDDKLIICYDYYSNSWLVEILTDEIKLESLRQYRFMSVECNTGKVFGYLKSLD